MRDDLCRCLLHRMLAVGVMTAVAVPAFSQSDPFQSNPAPPAAAKPRPVRPAPEREPEPALAPAPARTLAPMASSYDGRYTGSSPGVQGCREATFDVTVVGGQLSGGATNGNRTWGVHGIVAGDGSLAGTRGGQTLVGRFQGGSFQGTYDTGNPYCAHRTVTLQRAGAR